MNLFKQLVKIQEKKQEVGGTESFLALAAADEGIRLPSINSVSSIPKYIATTLALSTTSLLLKAVQDYWERSNIREKAYENITNAYKTVANEIFNNPDNFARFDGRLKELLNVKNPTAENVKEINKRLEEVAKEVKGKIDSEIKIPKIYDDEKAPRQRIAEDMIEQVNLIKSDFKDKTYEKAVRDSKHKYYSLDYKDQVEMELALFDELFNLSEGFNFIFDDIDMDGLDFFLEYDDMLKNEKAKNALKCNKIIQYFYGVSQDKPDVNATLIAFLRRLHNAYKQEKQNNFNSVTDIAEFTLKLNLVDNNDLRWKQTIWIRRWITLNYKKETDYRDYKVLDNSKSVHPLETYINFDKNQQDKSDQMDVDTDDKSLSETTEDLNVFFQNLNLYKKSEHNPERNATPDQTAPTTHFVMNRPKFVAPDIQNS